MQRLINIPQEKSHGSSSSRAGERRMKMPMCLSEFACAIEDQNTPIVIEKAGGAESIDTSAYMLRRVLHTYQHISGDNIVCTVSDETFESLKKLLNP